MIDRQEEKDKNRMLFWVVLSLIFVMPAAWRNPFATTFGQVFGYLTIIYTIFRGVSKKQLIMPKSMISLFGVILFWIEISVFNSIRFYSEYGVLSGETTFTAPLGSIYFHLFHVALFCGYIGLIQERTGIESTIHKGINIIIWIQIIAGVIQLMIVFGVPGISGIYDGINFLGMMPTASFIRGMSRITMTGSEPASMGASLGMLSFPYLLAVITETDSVKEKTTCWIKLFVLITLSYFSKSTTLFVIIAASAASYVLLSFREGRLTGSNTLLWIFIIMIVGAVMIISSFGSGIGFSNNIFEEIRYYLLVKPTDSANMSTMHRLSPTVNDIVIIKMHPLLGVGDGNQGFTYAQNVPSYMLINPKSQDFAKGIGGVVNGGAWFWAILSGYGIVGFRAIFIWYINHYRFKVKTLRKTNGFLYRIYIYALPAIILTLLAGAMEPKIVFILSIPFWKMDMEEDAS